MAHSRSFLAYQKARNAIFGAENLLMSKNRPFATVGHATDNSKLLAAAK